jgi:hypothetical protein
VARHYGAEDVIHALETALVMVSRQNAHLTEENIMLTKLATDLTAAVDNAIAKGGGIASGDAASIAADTARLNAAFSGTSTGTFQALGTLTTSIDQDQGTGPFVLSGLDPAAFSTGMGPLVSAASATSPIDPGTFSVQSTDTTARTVTVTSTDGWKPITGHVLGKSVTSTVPPSVLGTVVSATGTVPNLVITVSDIAKFSAGQTLVSKAMPTGPLDAGSMVVQQVSTAGQPAQLTVIATTDFVAIAGHALGIKGTLVAN